MSNNRTLGNLAQLLDSAASGSAISKRNGSIGTIAMSDSDVGGVAGTGFTDSNLVKNIIDINHITKVGGTTSSSDGLKAILQGNAPTTLNPSASATYNLGDSSNPIDEIILDSSATIFFGDISLTSILKSGTSTIAVAAVVANPVSGSAETSFLLKTDSTQTDAQVDASTNSATITENGDVKSTAFSPYHPKGYSSYFDGSGDYLTVADDASLDLSTGDFTIEAWVWVDSTNVNNAGIIGKRGTATFGTGNWRISFLTATNKIAMAHSNEDVNINTPEVTLNAWNHIAFCRSGTTLYCLANGALGDTDASYGHSFDNTESLYIGLNASLAFKGYIADVRILKGTALYTGSYDIPTERLTSITNTSLLTCHLPYIADGSSNAQTVTVNGDAKTTQFSQFDHVAYSPSSHGGSVYFDGSHDYMSLPANDGYNFGSNDFTLEAWVYVDLASISSNLPLVGWGTGSYKIIRLNSTGINVESNSPSNTSFTVSFASSPKTKTWNHIALVRSGNSFTAYLNGVGGTAYTSYTGNIGNGSDALNISYKSDPTYYTGYIADLRIVKGTAVYTANFTPPTEPLTAISGTQLLTCTNKNNIYDAGSGNLLTVVGNATTDTNTTKYSNSSVYLDGTVYVQLPAGSIHISGSQDYTLEGWINFNSIGGDQGIFQVNWPGNNLQLMMAYWSGWATYINGSLAQDTSVTPTTNQWYHIAVSRESGTVRVFLDGNIIRTVNSDTTAMENMGLVIGGYVSTSYLSDAYFEDWRVTTGLARYTASFTPPTAALEG